LEEEGEGEREERRAVRMCEGDKEVLSLLTQLTHHHTTLQ